MMCLILNMGHKEASLVSRCVGDCVGSSGRALHHA